MKSYRWQLIYGIVWLGFEVMVLVWFHDRWTGYRDWAFNVFMGFALFMQVWQIIDIGLKWYRTHAFMRGVMHDFNDQLEDAVRQPDDNRPYQRYRNGTIPMHPQDQAAFDKLFPDKDNGTEPEV